MVNGFVTLFTETEVVAWIVLAISLVCLIAEVFIPSFGLVGIGGIVLGLAGIGFNANKPWLTTSELVWLIVDTLVLMGAIVGLVKLVYVLTHGKNKKKKNATKTYLDMDGKLIPADDEGNPDFSFLKGKAGTCVTDLKPSGKVEIDGEVYNVLADQGYLYNGNMVRVIKTVGASVYVQKIQE